MPDLLAVLPDSWQQRYRRWLDRRIPPQTVVKLHQGNLFIFLSRQGLYFLLLIALVWIGATNFQNNLAYALSFFLSAMVVVAILQTFANASGLQLRFVDADPVFAGEVAHVRVELLSASAHQQLEFGWAKQESVLATVAAGEPLLLQLPLQTQQRGYLQPGRLRLQTFYPFGIVRCWSWLDLAVQVLVYPQPVAADYHLCSSGDGDDDGAAIVVGGDEYFALKPWTAGDTLSRVAWKQYAAGRGLFVREYAGQHGGEVMLDLSVMTDADLELRLSKLCYCALQLHEQGRCYGLSLPGQPLIAPVAGEPQLRAVLAALALYRPGGAGR